jgi:hypothetical protein
LLYPLRPVWQQWPVEGQAFVFVKRQPIVLAGHTFESGVSIRRVPPK